ncbi:MFS transporter [Gilvimarinus sp. F26214L]|uniref:MFS transporter n=1 Tax=Gilvimarinus sp. DZF01 TaxID=3461371 RepID=UPI0040457060
MTDLVNPAASARTDPASPMARVSWAFYDFASSSFAAIIATFVFPIYFTRQVAADETLGTSQWGATMGFAGLLIALGGPLLGAVADQYGRRKPWLGFLTLIAVLATASLWWVQPDNNWVLPAMLLAGLATVAAEFAAIFYNAMLPGLARPDHLGRWSGWAWGLGYAGGLLSLLLALQALVGDNPWLDLPRDDASHVRATFVLVAIWFGVFSLPLLLFAPDQAASGKRLGQAVGDGLKQLRSSIRELRAYMPILRFLLARMFFIDGLATLFAFGGVYAAGTFGFSEGQVLMFGIALNVSAGLGAAAFAWVDDWLGSKPTVLVCLAGLIALGSTVLVIQSTTLFWVLGIALGIFVGPVQAGSRSYMARVAPEHLRTQMFGLFALSGKITAFLGPLLVGWVTGLFGSQRAGMSMIILLLAIGFVLMLSVPAAKPTREA